MSWTVNHPSVRVSRRDIEWVDWPTMNPRNTRQLRRLVEIRTCAYLWGKKHFVTPRLCSEVFGNGRKLLRLYPVMYRPNHFVVRIDDGEDTLYGGDWLDRVYDSIEAEFSEWPWARAYGLRWTEDEDDDRSSRLHFGDGSCWGEMKWPRLRRARRPAI